MRPFTHHVLVRPTAFRASLPPESDSRLEFHNLYETLRNDDARNRMICADVLNTIKEGRSPLVLTERKEHLRELARLLAPDIPNIILLQGDKAKKNRKTRADVSRDFQPQQRE
jgi:hypothetical protein